MTENTIPPGQEGAYGLRIGDEDLTFTHHQINDPIITIEQILGLANARLKDEFDIYEFRHDGTFTRLDPASMVDLRQEGIESFLVFRTDRAFRLMIDDERYDWGVRRISGKALREIAHISPEMELWEALREQPDRKIHDTDLVDLNHPGTEKFYSRARTWKLKIRQNIYEFAASCITARQALDAAGFDLQKGWDLVLVSKSGRREIKIDDKIDLSEPGIEKLRVKPSVVNNGESQLGPRRDFSLLERDEDFLKNLGLNWRTVIDDKKRWLLIDGYELPKGLSASSITLALLIPAKYPSTQIDMFYCSPSLTLADGKGIAKTQTTESIEGITFQRWSRHRKGDSVWQPESDCVETHLELVEECIGREVNA
ncbi:multiubiquitin domain-containing protein [Tepidicaulis sp. LMO-SS28]|uniref:multiubiquitin domain-containing protein n=1 Tax=Tepidicaulis sp. LMO-SS28 TaxID=3447455 RepID=UPI003EE23E00